MYVIFENSSFGQSGHLIFILWNCHWIILSLKIEDKVLFSKHPIIIWPVLTGIILRSLNLTSANSMSDMASGSWLHRTLRSKYLLWVPHYMVGKVLCHLYIECNILCHISVYSSPDSSQLNISTWMNCFERGELVSNSCTCRLQAQKLKELLIPSPVSPAASIWEGSSIISGPSWIPEWLASTDYLSVLVETMHCVLVGNTSITLPLFSEVQFWMAMAGRVVL